MVNPDPQEITLLLEHWRQGDGAALDRLFHLIYSDLRKNAHRLIQKNSGELTLSATEIAHEAYLRLVQYPMNSEKPQFANRKQFFGLAQKAMVHILIDHNRRKQTKRHGGGQRLLPLEEWDHPQMPEETLDLGQLERFLGELAHTKPAWYHVLHQRFLSESPPSVEELAERMDLSAREIYRKTNWSLAWLRRRLTPPGRIY